MKYQTGLPIKGEVAHIKYSNLAISAPLLEGNKYFIHNLSTIDVMLSVRAHPNDWAFCINKLACYQISITLYGQLVLESASLPHLPPVY